MKPDSFNKDNKPGTSNILLVTNYQLSEQDNQRIAEFLQPYFGSDTQPSAITAEESMLVRSILAYIDERFGRMKYILGLALDFTLLAQRISEADPDAREFRGGLTQEALFQRYERITSRGGKLANTLTLRYSNVEYGIRRTEEAGISLFHELGRSSYPSSGVYTTGQRPKYPDLLLPCFQLSRSGRLAACWRIIQYGLEKLTANRFFGREVARARLFPLIITQYDRTPRRTENGGLVFQGIVFGYLTADRPHLDLIVDKVRTGSRRQKRFGDVDGYYGLDLELSAEVKDLHIMAQNLNAQLGEFAAQVAGNQINGLAFALSFDDEARRELKGAGVVPFTQDDLLSAVSLWDWPKQDRAVHGLLHYLSHIEQNPDATDRLLAFIAQHDESHPSLAYLTPDSGTDSPPSS